MPRLFEGVKNALPFIVKRSKRHNVYTTDNQHFLDLSCGIGVTNLGNCHDGVTAAVQKAASELVHAQMNIMKHEPMMQLIDKLASTETAKRADLDSWFLWNSGTEAVEAAIKLARNATGKPNIITMNLGYHGRTFMSMALTGSGTVYRANFQPLPSGIFPVPFPYMAHSAYNQSCPISNSEEERKKKLEQFYYGFCISEDAAQLEVASCLESVELLLRTQTSPSETACVLIEPVLGEGGYVPPPPGYLSGLRQLCDKYDMLLIADEVQTGFGRTGHLFACDWIDKGIRPDILIAAKGLANGLPLSAIGTRSDLSIKQIPGSMGGTYGGNAISCAAALAVFDAFENEGILDNVMSREKEVKECIQRIIQKWPGLVKEYRGKGLMIGVEFNGDYNYKDPKEITPGKLVSRIAKSCWDNKLIVLSCGPYDTLRLIPPLNIDKGELKECLDVFEHSVEQVMKSM